jgi:uncharacterized RmlC-like cupin family protein
MDRQQAISTDGMWAGYVRTDPGMVSGWHHHGEYDSSIYVLTGAFKLEFGEETAVANPGDFVLIPKHVVHRESNPTTEPAYFVVVRSGHGESNFNVDGPR